MAQETQKETSCKSPFFISYCITDPIIYGSTPEKFEKSLRYVLENNTIDILCFRDKISDNKKELARICLKVSKEFSIDKVLINSDIELCYSLGFDGIHFNSLQFVALEKIKPKELFTIISCHTEEEIIKAKSLNVNAVTYSPIFYKENKGKPKGLKKLSQMVKKYQDQNFSIVALGGIISNKHISEIIKTKAKGFASIRYFKF